MLSRLKSLDVYRKLPQDLTEPTLSGAIVSIVSTILMLVLFLTELNEFLKVQTLSEMFIDVHKGDDRLTVNIDLVMLKMPCDITSMDAQDVMGAHHVNVGGDLFKIRLDKDKQVIEELRHQDGDTSIDMNRTKKAFENGESCQIKGSFQVNKVPGNFHVSVHAYQHVYGGILMENNIRTIDVSHEIRHISFGNDEELKIIRSKFDKGVLNPLDGISKVNSAKDQGTMYQYYISVVPTTYLDLSGKELHVHQFTANSNELQTLTTPAVFFRYDLSPVTVKFSLTKESFFRFLVQICAIIGGIFTIAGIVDAVVHKSVVNIMKKASIGKLG